LDPAGSNIPQRTCPQGWRFIAGIDETATRAVALLADRVAVGADYVVPEILPGILCKECGGDLKFKLALNSPDG
jgi:hypothetical protein